MSSDQETKKPAQAWPVIREYFKATKKYPWLLTFLIVGALIIEIAGVVSPLYLRQFINVLSSGDKTTIVVASLLSILTAYGAVLLVGWIGQRMRMVLLMRIEGKVMRNLSNEAFANLLGHSYDFFVSNFAGTLTRRVNRYARSYEQVLDTMMFSFFSTAVFAIGAIGVLFARNALLGSILLAWTLIFVFLQIMMARWKHPLRIARSAEDSKVTGLLSDAVSNQSTINFFASSTYEKSLFAAAIESWYVSTMRSWNADAWIFAVQGIFAIIVEIGLLVGAVFLWQRGLVSVGDFVLIQVYVLGLIDRIWNIGNSMRRLYDAFADAYEMVVILETPQGITDTQHAKKLQVEKKEVRLNDVGFTFIEGQPILKDFSLTISGGEKIALVGPSGAGKSTVTKLLLRLYDVSTGSITVDGQDIREVTQDSLHEAIAFVPQEPILFHRSLMDNIRYGRQSATDEEVMEAAKKAHCHDFIAKLPEGYGTHVGERGVKLSGGERQRVAIARAILKNAPILILDEATSSLDSESESLIQDALKVLMEGKTVIVIAHRLSTIMTMDRIVVIEDGRIASEGTHTELLDQKGGLYHKLWSIQAGSFVADESA
ncbi:ABC transporter ATP-binding protein [soil metagenome]